MSQRDEAEQGPVRGTHTTAAPAEGGQPVELGAAGASCDPLPADQAASADAEDGMLPLAIPEPVRRGVGKPKGAVNIRTNTTFQAAVSRYGDPLIAEVAMGNMPTKELITYLRTLASDCGLKLGATVMDVLRFQADCRRAALPFGHAKRAPVNEAGETQVPIIAIGSVEVKEGGQVVISGLSLDDDIPEPNQKVIEHDPK